VRLSSIEVRLIKLTLVRPFETSFGRTDARIVPLVRMVADGVEGWGEIVADHEPLFSSETITTAQHVLADCFIPALLSQPLSSVDDVAAALRRFKGHQMAKAGLELAFMDLAARSRGVSIREAIGGTRDRVPVGVSLGIEKTVPMLVDQVLAHVAQGYQRIKLKIKPGWDLDVVRTVREVPMPRGPAVVAGNYLVVESADRFHVLDVSDRFNPIEVGGAALPPTPGVVAADGDGVLVAHAGAVDRLDISNPVHPQMTKTAMTARAPMQIHAAGGKVVIADRYALRVYGEATAAPQQPPARMRPTRR